VPTRDLGQYPSSLRIFIISEAFFINFTASYQGLLSQSGSLAVFSGVISVHVGFDVCVGFGVAVGRLLFLVGSYIVDTYIIQVSSFWHITYTSEHFDISAYKHGTSLRYK